MSLEKAPTKRTREMLAKAAIAGVLLAASMAGVAAVALKLGPETACHPEGTQKVRVLGGWTVDTVIQKIDNMKRGDYWELCRDGEAKQLEGQYHINEEHPPTPGIQLVIPARMTMDNGL